MTIKKTFICLEPGEKHSSLCILVKMSEMVGRLNPTMKFIYTVQALEALPPGINYFDTLELIKSRMKAHVMGDIRFILGYTYITESMARFFEKTSLKPAKITVTGEQEAYKDNFMLYVPYSEMLAQIDALNEQECLSFGSDTFETLAREDDDCDLTLGMTVWYAAQNLDRLKKKTE